MMPTPLKTFIIYAHEDRSTVNAIRGQLKIFEKKEILQIWDDGEILAGQDWDKSIKLKLESAQLILLFISVDFINSEYIEKTELQAALQRHHDGEAKLIPIIVRSCSWQEYFDLGKFQALPPQARPIRSYDLHTIDEAYYAVALGIKAAADEMQQKLAAAEQARQEEIDRETRKNAEAEKQKLKNERLQKQDEIAWKAALEAIEKAKTERGKMNALEVYLDEPEHKLYRVEAETQIEELKAAETARKIEEKEQEQLRLEAEREKRAAEQERKEQEAAQHAELKRQKLALKQAENERKKQEAKQKKKEQEEERLAEQARQEEIERKNLQKAEAEKQKLKAERLQKQDEIDWKATLEAIGMVKTEEEKIYFLEKYLNEPEHKIYRPAAEKQLVIQKAAEAAQRLEKKQQLESERKKRVAEQAEKGLSEMVFVRGGTFLMGSNDYNTACDECRGSGAKDSSSEKICNTCSGAGYVRQARDTFLGKLTTTVPCPYCGGRGQVITNHCTRCKGSGTIGRENEKPIHSVTLLDFEIGKYPVTQKFWQEIMGSNPAHFQGCVDCPVENVSWDDVQEFLKKLNQKYPSKNYRLPSEAEWEYAARGGKQSKGYTYAGSNDLNEVAWYDNNSGGKTQSVGDKKANELGIYDMSGNVWEWCQDAWHDNYQGVPTDGSALDSGSKDALRVLRGGSWGNNSLNCRVSNRNRNNPTNRFDFNGFRLARH